MKVIPIVGLVMFLFANEGWAATETLKSAGEATGRSGPLELTLRLHQVRLKPGETLWVQLEVRNVSTEPVHFLNGIFTDYEGEALSSLSAEEGTFLQIEDSRGRAIVYGPTFRPGDPSAIIVGSTIPLQGAQSPPMFTRLEPGKSFRSTPQADCDEEGCDPPGPYLKLSGYDLERPGRYRIRAVYDWTLKEWVQKETGLRPSKGNVRVETSWVEMFVGQ